MTTTVRPFEDHPWRLLALAWTAVLLCVLSPAVRSSHAQSAPGSFVNFESGHTRPLALSPDGSRLFALNTPDNRLAIFDVTAEGLIDFDPVLAALIATEAVAYLPSDDAPLDAPAFGPSAALPSPRSGSTRAWCSARCSCR